MQISEFAIHLLFLAFPGIIGAKFYEALQAVQRESEWDDYLRILEFSIVSYSLFDLGAALLNTVGDLTIEPLTLQMVASNTAQLPFFKIALVTLLSIPIAFVASYFREKRFIFKLGQKLKVSERHSGDDVWLDFFSNRRHKTWVYVRDHKRDVTYYGWVKHYSGSGQERELVIRDVDVFSSPNWEKVYDADVIYVGRERHDLSIEIPELGPILPDVDQVENGVNTDE